MRTATILAWGQIDWWPENLFRECCPCICLTLKLLSLHSGLSYVTVCSSTPPPPIHAHTYTHFPVKESVRRQTHSCVAIPTYVFLPVMCIPVSVCVCAMDGCVCVRARACVWESGREKAGEGESANPYSLWRIQGHSFMFCQPSVNQFPIKVVLNSAVIPIPSSRFRLTVSGVFR